MGSLSRMLWGTLIVFNIKMIAWIFRGLFNFIKLIFGGLFYLIGWIWSSIFSREKKPKQEIHERVETENLVKCADCGTMESSSLMTVCPDCGSYLCSECRKHHNCTTQVESEPEEQADPEIPQTVVGEPAKNTNPDLITCTGCGKQHPKSAMRKCHTCGAVLCPSCRKHQVCGEEMVECMGCGERYPKSAMRKCHTCGDVLCPSCRKHHVCTEKKGSLDRFLESESQKPSDTTHVEENPTDEHVVPVSTESPYDEAKEWFQKGQMYADGDGVEKDIEQAMYWYTRSAEAGYALAQFTLGLRHLLMENYDKASHWLRKADGNGLVFSDFVPDVMNTIASSFMKGNHNDEALYWYTRGAEQGLAESQYMLGIQYIANLIVAKDYKKAIYWFEKADKQGYEGAHDKLRSTQYDLGNAYYYGWHNYPKDYRESVRWFEQSALNGYAEGQRELCICYLNGTGVHTNPEKAIYWLKKAVEQGDSEAKRILGLMYLDGDHVPKDTVKGFNLIKEAAEAEEPDECSFIFLGACYCEGIGVHQDLDKARYWLKKSSEMEISLEDAQNYCRNHPELGLSL